MYTVLEDEQIRFENGKFIHRVTLVANTPEDVPTTDHPEDKPDVAWAPGSIAIIPDASATYMLNNEGEWKKWQ